jgi:hypothetical protein
VFSLLTFGTLKDVIEDFIEEYLPLFPGMMLYLLKKPDDISSRHRKPRQCWAVGSGVSFNLCPIQVPKQPARLCGLFIYPASRRAEKLVNMVILVVVDTFLGAYLVAELGVSMNLFPIQLPQQSTCLCGMFIYPA